MTTTSSISSLGVGSGLDAESIVTKLVALERQPITQLKSEATKLQTKISAYGKIQSAVATLKDAAQKLTDSAIWQSTSAQSTDSTSVQFSTSTGAATGSYNVAVSTLAASQSVVSNKVFGAATDTVGAGTLTIDMGSWSGGVFTAKSGNTPLSVTVGATDSLESVRDKINALGSGVSASIVNDASGARMVITSKETGVANGFRIQVTNDQDTNNTDNLGLSALAYDPQNGTTGTTLNQAPSDALAAINGITVRSSSNTFSNVLSGISVTVGKVTTGTVVVSVGQDTTGLATAISDLANAFTALSNLLKTNTDYNAGSKTGGALQGDSAAVGTLNQFRSLLGSSASGSTVFPTLASIGLESKGGGVLTVNTTKLNNALNNSSEVRKLLTNVDAADTSKNGFAARINTLTSNLLSVDGVLTTKPAGLNNSVKLNEKRQAQMEDRASLYEKRLRAQYTALDKYMASISTQGNYVSQMIAGLNAKS